LGEGKISVAAPAADGKRYTATGTVKLLVSDDAERTTIKPLTLSCPAYQAPEKLGIDFTQPGAFIAAQVKEVGFITQGNATIVKVLDVPVDWTVDIATSGAAGTFTITAPGEETGLLGALVFVSDAAGNTVMRTLELAYTPVAVTPSAALNGGDRTLSVINAEMAVVEYTAAADITGGTLTDAPAGVSGSFTGNTFSVYGTPTESGTKTYTVALAINDPSYCAAGIATGVLEVENCTNCAVWAGYCGDIKYVSNNQSEATKDWYNANSTCNGKGTSWRLPTRTELECMCGEKGTLPNSYVSNDYWSSTLASYDGYYYYYVVHFSNCHTSNYRNRYDVGFSVKCVK
jgi:hypothetical protein